MERGDLLQENAKIFIPQGRALNDYASRDVRYKCDKLEL